MQKMFLNFRQPVTKLKLSLNRCIFQSKIIGCNGFIFTSMPTGFVEQIEGQEQGVNSLRFEIRRTKIENEVTQNEILR